MIKKSFEFNTIKLNNYQYYLFYGDNDAQKSEIIDEYFKKKFLSKIFRYEENEVLSNSKNFLDEILTKSFFENEKLILITRSTDKILKIFEEIIEKKIQDIYIIFFAENLDKKSKLRNFFEKEKDFVCTPFYPDNYKNLLFYTSNFFKEKKIQASQEIINLIINRANNNRQSLKNELQKIENFTKKNKRLEMLDIVKLTNLSENHNVSELVDCCLAKNKNKIHSMLNENNFTKDDTILIIRTFLNKTKRLIKLKNQMDHNKNIDEIISLYKPPIFWKDKEIIKEQMNNWSTINITNFLYKISEIELMVKKNYENSIRILLNFILSNCAKTN